MQFTAEQIAGFLGGEIAGDKAATVHTVAKIEEAGPGSLAFLSNPKYEPYLYTTGASIVIVSNDLVPREHVKATLVKVADPYACFARLLELYAASKPKKTGISPLACIHHSAICGKDLYAGEYAVIGEQVQLGDGCSVYPQVYIGDRVRIGSNVTLYPGVKIYEECVIGDNVTIHAGSVIGADGFGFAPQPDGSFEKIPQIGNVVIKDNVEIGANTCIDRATMGSTVIERGVKLDNLIQIGHNAAVGENTVAAAQVGIAGSTKVGSNCMFGGQVGIAGHLTVGDRVQIGSKTGVPNSLPGDNTYLGSPAMPGSKYHRSHAIFRNLPQLSADVHELKKQVKALTEACK